MIIFSSNLLTTRKRKNRNEGSTPVTAAGSGRNDFENLLSRWTQEIRDKEEQGDVAGALGIAVNALRAPPRPGWESCCILRLAGGVAARNRKLLVGHLCKELLQELRSLDNYKSSGTNRKVQTAAVNVDDQWYFRPLKEARRGDKFDAVQGSNPSLPPPEGKTERSCGKNAKFPSALSWADACKNIDTALSRKSLLEAAVLAQRSDWPTAYWSIEFAKQIAEQYQCEPSKDSVLEVRVKDWNSKAGASPTLRKLFTKLSAGGQTALVAWAKYDIAVFPNLPMHGLNVHAEKYDEEGCSMTKLRDAVIECAEGPPAAGTHDQPIPYSGADTAPQQTFPDFPGPEGDLDAYELLQLLQQPEEADAGRTCSSPNLQVAWLRDGNFQEHAGLHHLPDTSFSGDIPSGTPNHFSLGAAIGSGHDGIVDDVDLTKVFDNIDYCYTQHLGCLHLNVKAAVQGPRQQLALLRRTVDMLNKSGRLFCITVTLWGQQLTIHKDTEKKAPVATWGKLQVPHITSAYFSSVDASQFVLEGNYLEGARVWAFCAGQKPVEYLKLAPTAAHAGSGGSGQHQKVEFLPPEMLRQAHRVWLQAKSGKCISAAFALPRYTPLLKPVLMETSSSTAAGQEKILKQKQATWRRYMYPQALLSSASSVDEQKSMLEVNAKCKGPDNPSASDAAATQQAPTLLCACKSGLPAHIIRLLESGADATQQDGDGFSCLHAALQRCKNSSELEDDGRRRATMPVVVGRLLEAGGAKLLSCRTAWGHHALHFAAASKNGDAGLQAMAASLQGTDLSPRDSRGLTPLHWAAKSGNVLAIRWLLKHGADVSTRDYAWATPLHYAMLAPGRSVAATVDLLIMSERKGAREAVRAADINQQTPLHWMSSRSSIPINLSLKLWWHYLRAVVTMADALGNTPLHLFAALGSQCRVIDRLVAMGASMTAVNAQGDTPVHTAAGFGNCSKAQLQCLLRHCGAASSSQELLKLTNTAGFSPLQLAAVTGWSVANVLLLAKSAESQQDVDRLQHLVAEYGWRKAVADCLLPDNSMPLVNRLAPPSRHADMLPKQTKQRSLSPADTPGHAERNDHRPYKESEKDISQAVADQADCVLPGKKEHLINRLSDSPSRHTKTPPEPISECSSPTEKALSSTSSEDISGSGQVKEHRPCKLLVQSGAEPRVDSDKGVTCKDRSSAAEWQLSPGLREEWDKMMATSFHAYSSTQISDFLVGPRLDISDLLRLSKLLHLPVLSRTAADDDFKALLVDDILNSLKGPGGPFRLLHRMHRKHLHAFLEEHWEEISNLNDPVGCGYDMDHASYTKHNCMLFILWAWDCRKQKGPTQG